MSLSSIDDLKRQCAGAVLVPGDTGYEEGATTFVMKGAPAVIVQSKVPGDVSAAVTYARQNGLKLTVKSGGHSVAGLSMNDGGLVIDLVHMDEVTVVDEAKRIVRIGAGATWKKVGVTLQKHKLALSSGDTTTVGVGGLVLGGGIGWMVRKYGLTIDNVVAAEVVTADGNIVRASKTDNPDLFWAIRGGGGNFGVVTHFEFVAQPVTTVFVGTISYKVDSLPDVLKGIRNYMRSADRELTTILNIMSSFGENPPMLLLSCCYAGNDETAAMAAIEPLLSIGTVIKKDITEKPYVDVLEEAHPPENMKVVVKNVFIESFTDDVIAAILTARKKRDMVIQIRSLGGAIQDVSSKDTAFAHRDSEVLVLSPTFLPPNATDAEVQEALKPWNGIAALGSGAYINFLSTHRQEDVEAAYPKETYERLFQLKKKYDPDNVFNINFNIVGK